MTDIITPVEQELIRFFNAGRAYQKETGKPACMPSCLVDEAWHSLLQDEARYKTLTSQYLNANVEHLQNKGVGEIEWVTFYEKMYGKLSKEWFTSSEGAFDSTAFNEYLQKGKLYAAWDCTPGYKPTGKEKPKNVSTLTLVC